MSKRRIVIKASKSTADMLDAFEAKLAELNVESSTDVECATGDPEMDDIMTEERHVNIDNEDYSRLFKDVGGGFDVDDEIISLADMKQYWNDNNMGDPVLEEYIDFDSWFKDTRSNFLEEYYED